MSRVLTPQESELIRRVKVRLGDGLRNVELSDEMLVECLDQAFDMVNAHHAAEDTEIIRQHQNDQLMRDYSDRPEVLSVSDVHFSMRDRRQLRNLSIFHLAERSLLGRTMTGSNVGTRRTSRPNSASLIELQMQREQIKRVFSTEEDWRYDPVTKILDIYTPMQPLDITIYLMIKHDAANIPPDWNLLVLKAIEGYARQLLGDVRGKYLSIPGPTGDIQIDADTQRQRGQEMVREVEEMFRAMPPTARVRFG